MDGFSSSLPLLILPLVGGYVFSATWTGSLYRSAREEGHRLYFRAAFYGVFLIVCAIEIHISLFSWADWYYEGICGLFREIAKSDEPVDIWDQSHAIPVAALAFILGPFLAQLLNLARLPALLDVILPNGVPDWVLWIWRRLLWWDELLLKLAISNNDFEKLLFRSIERSLPVMLTLNTGKVYVGWVVQAPNPIEQRRAIRILPLLSGCREPADCQRVRFTTNYYTILEELSEELGRKHMTEEAVPTGLDHLQVEDFEVVLPSSQVVSAHLFDITAYERFQGPSDGQGEAMPPQGAEDADQPAQS